MAYRNNIYGNAAFVGFLTGMIASRAIVVSDTATDYAALKNAAIAMAIDVDALIPFDALVTTGSAITQLASTTNVIQANEQFRAGLLQEICAGAVVQGGFTEDATVAGEQTERAAAIVALWTEAIAALVTP